MVLYFLLSLGLFFAVICLSATHEAIFGGGQTNAMLGKDVHHLRNCSVLDHLGYFIALFGFLSLLLIAVDNWLIAFLGVFFIFILFDWSTFSGSWSFFSERLNILQFKERKVDWWSIVGNLTRLSSSWSWLPTVLLLLIVDLLIHLVVKCHLVLHS